MIPEHASAEGQVHPDPRHMTSSRWVRVEALFHEALNVAVADRDAFLRLSCGRDDVLREQVESLLVADAKAGDFAERREEAVQSAWAATHGHGIGPGTQIGRYEIQALVGAGGLGAVYKAYDARLHRIVALKVLHPHVAYGPSSQAHIEREARTLAGLSHPHICPVFDVGREGGISYLVMQYLAGETLADKLALGPVPIDEALRYGIEIVDALDNAHGRGIVHRDVKPGNVMLTGDGAQLLDFGLAQLLPAGKDATVPGGGLTRDGTAVTPGSAGAALGTPQYMAPEQLKGAAIDARTDLFAFGAVLYEMLTGRRAFNGNTPAELETAITTTPPPSVSSVLPSIPPALDRLVGRCLARNPADRWAAAGDVRAELTSIKAALAGRSPDATAAAPAVRNAPRWRAMIAYVIAVAFGAAGVWLMTYPQPAPPLELSRVGLPADAPYVPLLAKIDLSADGAQLLYSGTDGSSILARDRLAVTRLNLRNASGPFFSPNGQRVGYFVNGTLRVRTAAGSQETIASGFGMWMTGSWGADNNILVSDSRGLWRVSPVPGARPQQLKVTPPEPGRKFLYPMLLPGGRHVLSTLGRADTFPLTAAQAADASVEIIDLETGARRLLVRDAGMATFVDTGHLVYLARGVIHAIPFDLKRMMVQGDPVPVVSGASNYAVSADGTLVYAAANESNRTLVWVDRHGVEDPLGAPPMPYAYPRLSPDESQIAIDVNTPDRDILMWNLQGKATLRRFSLDDSANPLLAWTRDGRRIVYGSFRSGVPNLYIQDVRSGAAHRLTDSPRLQMPLSFAPRGQLLFSEEVPGHRRDIRALSLDDPRLVTTVVGTPATEGWAEVSPDGRWLAYDSDESGDFEVYVMRYGATGSTERRRVSSGGGKQPLWSRSGHELYYRDVRGALLVVKNLGGSAFTPSAPIEVLEGGRYFAAGRGLSGRTYDVDRDGRFLMVKNNVEGEATVLVQVRNWFTQGKRQDRRGATR